MNFCFASEKALNNSEVVALESLCYAGPSTLRKTLKRDWSDWPILSQPSHITPYEQQNSSNQKLTKTEKAAHVHLLSVPVRWWKRVNGSILLIPYKHGVNTTPPVLQPKEIFYFSFPGL